jgi:hypothetical protein
MDADHPPNTTPLPLFQRPTGTRLRADGLQVEGTSIFLLVLSRSLPGLSNLKGPWQGPRSQGLVFPLLNTRIDIASVRPTTRLNGYWLRIMSETAQMQGTMETNIPQQGSTPTCYICCWHGIGNSHAGQLDFASFCIGLRGRRRSCPDIACAIDNDSVHQAISAFAVFLAFEIC